MDSVCQIQLRLFTLLYSNRTILVDLWCLQTIIVVTISYNTLFISSNILHSSKNQTTKQNKNKIIIMQENVCQDFSSFPLLNKCMMLHTFYISMTSNFKVLGKTYYLDMRLLGYNNKIILILL